VVTAGPLDGLYSFTYHHGMRYTGQYSNGLREGPWKVLNADGSDAWEVTWRAGEWHGPSVTWWNTTGSKHHEGQHERGKRAGQWTFWFPDGQMAAEGQYADDRKIGEWSYWDQDGTPMQYDEWSRKFEQWDWAYDDYTGFPRGENWPNPPPGCEPIDPV
jgi:antitoxin component YwqK of YwqJK toxin-antitoxin module